MFRSPGIVLFAESVLPVEVVLTLKAVHIMAFAAWMAGMWYLPRLMVYHSDAVIGSELSETLKTMERRLLGAIMTPAMTVTLVVGLGLAWSQGQLWEPWLQGKLVLVSGMVACHGLLLGDVRSLAIDRRKRSSTWYRVFNEIPTVLFIAIVLLVVFKPS